MSASVIVLSKYLNKRHIEKLENTFNAFDGKYAPMVTKIVNSLDIPVKTGDIVQTSKDVYRNDYKVIWVNDKCVELNSDYDEYGAVPPIKELCVLKHFPITYWKESIDHNSLVPLNHKDFKDQLLRNYTVCWKELGISSFIYGPINYTVYFDWEESDSPHDIKSVLDYEGIYLYETRYDKYNFVKDNLTIFYLTVADEEFKK